MTNEDIILKLYEIGKLPSDRNSESNIFPIEKFYELVKAINLPVSAD